MSNAQKLDSHDDEVKTNTMCGRATTGNDDSGRSVQRIVRCSFGLLIVLLFIQASTSTAIASCGDYLHRGPESHDQLMLQLMLSDEGLRSEAPMPSDPRTPCHGPRCRSTPIPAAPSVPTSLIERQSETAALLTSEPATLVEWSAPIFPLSSAKLTSRECSIFRPPCN